jgi:hypothetical protein
MASDEHKALEAAEPKSIGAEGSSGENDSLIKQSNRAGQTAAQLTPAVIQQYLDENQLLIQAIVDNHNTGRYEDCVKYQEKLHQNLLFLSSLADTV